MHVTYDSRADAIYIRLKEGDFSLNREVVPGVVFDLGPDDDLLGIEILDASLRLKIDVSNVTVEMPLDVRAAND